MIFCSLLFFLNVAAQFFGDQLVMVYPFARMNGYATYELASSYQAKNIIYPENWLALCLDDQEIQAPLKSREDVWTNRYQIGHKKVHPLWKKILTTLTSKEEDICVCKEATNMHATHFDLQHCLLQVLPFKRAEEGGAIFDGVLKTKTGHNLFMRAYPFPSLPSGRLYISNASVKIFPSRKEKKEITALALQHPQANRNKKARGACIGAALALQAYRLIVGIYEHDDQQNKPILAEYELYDSQHTEGILKDHPFFSIDKIAWLCGCNMVALSKGGGQLFFLAVDKENKLQIYPQHFGTLVQTMAVDVHHPYQMIVLTRDRKLLYINLASTILQGPQQRSFKIAPSRTYQLLHDFGEYKVDKLWFYNNKIGVLHTQTEKSVLTVFQFNPGFKCLQFSTVKSAEDPHGCLSNAVFFNN